jgi:uncharacterized protein DUF5675
MIALRLTRQLMTPDCTRGTLEVFDSDGETALSLFTIEKPWISSRAGGKAGEPFRSCIGEGTYSLSPYQRPNGDKVWILSNPALDVFKLNTDIPADRKATGRFLILIHIANRARDVVGCIGPGRSWRTEPDGTVMVTSSRDAMKDLHKLLDGRRNLEIEIVNAHPLPAQPPEVRTVSAIAPKLTTTDSPNLHNWLRVPQGSRLLISLTGTETKKLVTGSGDISSDKSPSRRFHDDEVQPGPLVVQLVGQDACTVTLNLQFGTAATAEVTAFVEDRPAGTHSPGDYQETFSRAQGSSETILFNVVTV